MSFELYFPSENAVDPKTISKNKWNANGNDKEKNSERFLARSGVVNGECVVRGVKSGENKSRKCAEAKENEQRGNGSAGGKKGPAIIPFSHLVGNVENREKGENGKDREIRSLCKTRRHMRNKIERGGRGDEIPNKKGKNRRAHPAADDLVRFPFRFHEEIDRAVHSEEGDGEKVQ